MSRLFALDPGTAQSALVCLDAEAITGAILPNEHLIEQCRANKGIASHLVIEQIASYGMPVGADVFDTCVWIGRFREAWEQSAQDATCSLLPRKVVKLTLCGTVKAKDANIRQALIDRYGGPACVRKGGPLAGIKSHMWAALAVGVAYREIHTTAAALVACEGGPIPASDAMEHKQ